MTWCVVPPTNCVTETTNVLSGSTARETMCCSPETTCARTTIGSRVWCGEAAWPPLPWIVIQKVSGAAIAGPIHHADLPHLEQRPDVGADLEIEAIHDASSDHLVRSAGELLLGLLKEEAHLAGQLIRHRGEDLRGTRQHRGVCIMPARVHGPRPLGTEFEVVLLLNR